MLRYGRRNTERPTGIEKGMIATCAECLAISEGFNIVKDMEEWAGRKIEIVPEKKSEKNEKNSEPT